MSKKKRSTVKRVKKQMVNNSSKRKEETKATTSWKILKYFGNILLAIVLKEIFEKPIGELITCVWSLVIKIFS